MDSLLSIDLGTTACKAAIYSLEGQLLGDCAQEYPLIYPGPTAVEQDPHLWWSLALHTMQQAVCRAGEAGSGVRAISVSSQGISFVPVDRRGAPLRNALCWLDTRASVEAGAIRAKIDDRQLFHLTGKRPSAAYILPKLLWLRTHEPEVYGLTHKFLLAHDYLISRMCGRQVTDYSLAGGSLLLDIHTLSWSNELLSVFMIDPEKLPELAWSGTIAGELDRAVAKKIGLPPGIPVSVGGQDQKCAALGAAIQSGVVTISLGTAAAISCLTAQPALDPWRRIPAFPFVVPGSWVLEGVVGTAGAAVRWVRDVFFPGEDYLTLDQWAGEAQPGAGGVCFYPHMAGATSPAWDAEARGRFTGLNLSTGKSEIARSILEGVAYQVRANLEVIAEFEPVGELVLFGGGARSKLWCRIIAEVAGKPVRVLASPDIANWGACLLAGVGAGIFGTGYFPDVTVPSEWIDPDPGNIRRYQALYEAYRQEP